ncbi:MAG TPA: GNAT family N-acetyltransferase [Candidatus Binatia bacterium]|nr:GNAT family N-acetyltransferase [Candidatus Binatia bacterium]
MAQFGESFRRSLEAQKAGSRLHLLALDGNRPVASGQLLGYSKSVEIADLAVAPGDRGKGLGTAVIAVLERVARYCGYDEVEICVMRGNHRALALYRRLGFVPDREFSLSETATVLVLQKALDGAFNGHISRGVPREQ